MKLNLNKATFFGIFFFFCSFATLFAQAPRLDWHRQEGLGGEDFSRVNKRAFDGSLYVLIGFRGTTNIGGQVYVSQGSTNTYDFVLTKYSVTGNFLWGRQIWKNGNSSSYDPQMQVDGNGNVFMAIGFGGTLTFSNATGNPTVLTHDQTQGDAYSLVKYGNNGNLIFANKIITTVGISGSCELGISSTNEIVIASNVVETLVINNISYSYGADSYAGFVATYDANGNYLKHGPVSFNYYWPWGVVHANFDGIYTVGQCPPTTLLARNGIRYNTPDQFAIIKCSDLGLTYWVYPLLNSELVSLSKPLLLDNGNITFIARAKVTFTLAGTQILAKQTYIAKLNNAGVCTNAYPIASTAIGIRGFSKDIQNNYYISGYYTDSIRLAGMPQTTLGQGGYITKISQTGVPQWQKIVTSNDIIAFRSDVYNDNEVYVSGSFSGQITFENQTLTSVGSSDFLAAKLSGCVLPPVTVTASGNTTICNGQSVSLTASNLSNVRYQWLKNNVAIPNETRNQITINQAGSYRIAVSAGSCADTSVATQIRVSNTAFNITTVPVSASGICPNATLRLTTSLPFTTYRWSNGGQQNAIDITQAGSYGVTITDANSCKDSNTLVVRALTPPVTPSIIQGTNVKLRDNVVRIPSTHNYKWLLDGSVVGDNSQFHCPRARGVYQLEVTEIATGCKSYSNQIDVNLIDATGQCTGTGTNDLENADRIKMYPNPTDKELIIDINDELNVNKLMITNSLGAELKTIFLNTNYTEINVSAYSNGLYFIVFYEGQRIIARKKVVIHK